MSAPTVKCLVWDLDETLWQGTLLEGDGVVLRPGTRETLAELDRRGVLHSVASRNDHDAAWRELERLEVAEFFVFPQIGWGRKPDAVRTIADRLQFATDTIAFVDDQPQERAEVAMRLPEVRCYTPEEVACLPARAEFTPSVVTADAARRRQRYQQGAAREQARQDFTGPDEDFLRSLGLDMRIARATRTDLDRLSELTVRTSQMNATGVPYTHQTLLGLIDDPGHEVLAVSMSDRFGSHGAVGVVLLGTGHGTGHHGRNQQGPAVWQLKLLATSCRVVSFGAGSVILRWLTDQAARAGVDLVADFRRTERNRMMEVAYRFAGFSEAPPAATATLPPAPDGVQRLLLRPTRLAPAPTVRVHGPDLAPPGAVGEREWIP